MQVRDASRRMLLVLGAISLLALASVAPAAAMTLSIRAHAQRADTTKFPMPYSWLSLDQPGSAIKATWTTTIGPKFCKTVGPSNSLPTTAALTSGSAGTGQIDLSWDNGQVDLDGLVYLVDPGEFELDLSASFSAGGAGESISATLSGYGPSFSGPVEFSSSGDGCTWKTDDASLSLDGTGLTCSASAGDSESAVLNASMRGASLFGPACPLFLQVDQVLQGGGTSPSPFQMTSGLKDTPTDVHHVAFLTTAEAFEPSGCITGCADISVTVGLGQKLDESGNPVGINDPVENATVTAAIYGIETNGEIINANAGQGSICGDATLFGNGCGSSATAKTGTDGKATFRYWGPASWQIQDKSPPEVFIKFTATAHDCLESACVFQETKSPTSTNVVIKSNVALTQKGYLSSSEQQDLIQWSSTGAISSGIQKLATDLGKLKVFTNLKLLKALKSASKGLKLSTRVSSVVFLYLFEKKFNLKTEGLDNTNFAQIETFLLSLIKNPLVKTVATKLATAVFGKNNVFDDQFIDMIKAYATWLRVQSSAHVGNYLHLLALKVYEGSYCLDFNCPPTLPPDPVVRGPGVHYNLFFTFSSEEARTRGTNGYFKSFNVDTGYAPPTWIPWQCSVTHC
jgi:hypothetical protein